MEKLLEQLKFIVKNVIQANGKITLKELRNVFERTLQIPVLDKQLSKYLKLLDNKLSRLTSKTLKPFNLNINKILGNRINYYKTKLTEKMVKQTFIKLKKTSLEIAKNIADGDSFNEAFNKGMLKVYDEGILQVRTGRGVQDVESYTRTVANTELQKARVDLQKVRTKAYGYDLVKIQVQSDGCPVCSPFEDMIISMNGQDTLYPTLDDIEAQGFLHPNCRCEMITYDPEQPRSEDIFMFEQDRAIKYEDSQQQRYMERKIREYKRKEAITIGEQQEKYGKKVREWQGKMREFIKETDRVRDYSREK